jgi:hypothetical protein
VFVSFDIFNHYLTIVGEANQFSQLVTCHENNRLVRQWISATNGLAYYGSVVFIAHATTS